MEFCPHCGARILPGMARCESCGAPIGSEPPVPPVPEAAPSPAEPWQQPAGPERPGGQGPAPAGPCPPEDEGAGDAPPARGPKYARSVREEDGPLSVSACLGTLLLFLIPVVGLVIMCCFANGRGIPAGRRNLARACLLLAVAFLFLLALARLLMLFFGGMAQQAVYNAYFGLY